MTKRTASTSTSTKGPKTMPSQDDPVKIDDIPGESLTPTRDGMHVDPVIPGPKPKFEDPLFGKTSGKSKK